MKPYPPWQRTMDSNKSSEEVRETAFALVWGFDLGWPPGPHKAALSLPPPQLVRGSKCSNRLMGQDKVKDTITVRGKPDSTQGKLV